MCPKSSYTSLSNCNAAKSQALREKVEGPSTDMPFGIELDMHGRDIML